MKPLTVSPRRSFVHIVMILAALFMSAGCAGTKPYAKLAEAGSAYTGSLVTMTDKSNELNIESSSYSLLKDHDGVLARYPASERKAILDRMRYQADSISIQNIASVGNIKRTAMALQGYFNALKGFSESTAPQDTATEMNAVLNRLYDAMKEANPSFDPPPDSAGLISVVSRKVSESILKEELIARKETIQTCMVIFDRFIDSFERDILADMKNIRNRKYLMNAVSDFTSGKQISRTVAKRYIDARSEYMQGIPSALDVAAARSASGNFRKVFSRMTAGEAPPVSMEELQQVIDDFKTVSSFIQSL